MQQAVAVIQRSFTPHILPAGILPFANTLISFFRFLWSFCCPAPGNRIITVAARVRVINPVELRYITAEDVLKFSYLPPVMLKPSIFLFVHGITTIWRKTTLEKQNTMDFYYTALPQAVEGTIWIDVVASARSSKHEFYRTAKPAVGPGVIIGSLEINDLWFKAFLSIA